MNTRSIVWMSAVLCFGSFVWGMIWHFRRVGKPTRVMLVTAVLAATSAIAQMAAIRSRPVFLPSFALGLYAMSAALFWWAVSVSRGKLAACGQRFVSPAVLKDGPYRYIRHPFYTAYNLTWLAGFVATGWWPAAVGAVIMASLYERSAREEEEGFLSSVLAAEYSEYRRLVGKYSPRFGL